NAFAGPISHPTVRLRALSALITAGDKTVLDLVTTVLDRNKNPEFAGQILNALGRLDDPRVAPTVLKKYPTLPAEVQPKAIELLTQRAIWAKPLVEAIGANKIPASALNVIQIQRLLALKDAELA